MTTKHWMMTISNHNSPASWLPQL